MTTLPKTLTVQVDTSTMMLCCWSLLDGDDHVSGGEDEPTVNTATLAALEAAVAHYGDAVLDVTVNVVVDDDDLYCESVRSLLGR